MPAYKDKEKGTWYASFYYEDWTGKKVKKMKRGFPTKREALEWERTFLQQQTADLEMTFENFVAVYVADMKGRNTVLLGKGGTLSNLALNAFLPLVVGGIAGIDNGFHILTSPSVKMLIIWLACTIRSKASLCEQVRFACIEGFR